MKRWKYHFQNKFIKSFYSLKSGIWKVDKHMGAVVKMSILLARPSRALEWYLECFFLSAYYLGTTEFIQRNPMLKVIIKENKFRYAVNINEMVK